MFQPPSVTVKEGTDVRQAIFEHGEPVESHAEGEPLIDVGVNPTVGEDFRVNHAAAEDFKPILSGAKL